MTEAQRQRANRDYLRANRDTWRELGFGTLTTFVHKDEKEVVSAELIVQRFAKLAQIAEDMDTPLKLLVIIAQRNISAIPKDIDYREAMDNVDNLKDKDNIEFAVEQAKEAMKKYHGAVSNVDRSEDVTKQQRLYAKMVAYGNLAHAWISLARARRKASGVITVFNAKRSA